jgi:cation:H+ antiporter
MTNSILLFIFGLIVLILGADLLVRGASRLAAAFGVSPLVIGLTIVAIGTASPEIAVSLKAAASGQGDLTLGNVLGSNIFNILFILGVTSIAAPIVIAEQLIRKDTPIMLGASLLTLVLSLDGKLGSLDGALLLASLSFYMIFVVKQSRAESREVQNEYAGEFAKKESHTAKQIVLNIGFILIGIALLVVGSDWLVESAVRIAKFLGVSELVIGLTVVAVGTSMPEIATSVTAALKKENDIAVGNAVGSNIFNLLGVLGVAALFAPDGVTVAARVLQFDLPVMVFVALVSLPIFYIDNRISRVEGGLLLTYYIVYVTCVVLRAVQSPALPALTWIAGIFVPISFIALVVIAFRSAHSKPRA